MVVREGAKGASLTDHQTSPSRIESILQEMLPSASESTAPAKGN